MNKREILEKPYWGLGDIKSYVGCKQTRASSIMQAAKRIGISRFYPSKAKRDNVLLVLGLDFKEEVNKLKLLEEI